MHRFLKGDGIWLIEIANLFFGDNKGLLIDNKSFFDVHIMVDCFLLNVSCCNNVIFHNFDDVELRLF